MSFSGSAPRLTPQGAHPTLLRLSPDRRSLSGRASVDRPPPDSLQRGATTLAVKFTEKAEQVLIAAGNEAKRRSHDYIGTEHILFGILQQTESVAVRALRHLDVDPDRVSRAARDALDRIPPAPKHEAPPLTPNAKRSLELSGDEAVRAGHYFVGTEHLLVGVAREEEGIGARILAEHGIDPGRIIEAVHSLLGPDEPKVEKQGQVSREKSKLTVLSSFGVDLTDQAARNKLDPVIGRHAEIDRLIQILSRKTKNNPVVLGEPGVGKTAIVEGLAQRIADRSVPEILQSKHIFSLDLAAVLAGTKYRGEFEKRLKTIIGEVVEAGNIIIFIDEVHTMMGAGASESSLDASNILKPPLSRGDFQCIGATTLDEYRKHIEKDGAMERRFQPLIIDPPTQEEAIEILRGLRDGFEAHHRVRITDEAVIAAVELSSRYITGRFLPDKAIDVVDEAASHERLRRTTKPPNVTEIESEIQRLEREKESAVRGQDFERAADIRDRMEKLRDKRDEIIRRWKNAEQELDAVVDDAAIAETVAAMTGIPVANIREDEAARILRMEECIHEMVVSQDHAVRAVAQAIRRARAGLKDPDRPLGSFVFVGPTGVGKSLLAKAIAKFLFGSEEALLQVDMSEYMERHNVSRLIGSPPGYVGYDEGGQLTEKIRRKPYAVVLLDEIEKAHPDFTNVLLQILEEGHLTDSFGRRIDFRNTILIMTSNLGSRTFTDSGGGLGFRPSAEATLEERRAQVIADIQDHFRPEFLNRIDDIVVFDFLNPEDLRRIFDIELRKVAERLNRRRITVEVDPAAEDHLIRIGYSDRFGARGIRRVIEERIENPLSELILTGKIRSRDRVDVRLEEGDIHFQVGERANAAS
ncbi:MAG: ATP-dependent Clp protease ATP-binding subunit [Planctomycetes bacterium]|nr:ATP-dependent Clp protease ATP-binding subunit [Planctomycetota bacterium]